jgi:hypothetical protein
VFKAVGYRETKKVMKIERYTKKGKNTYDGELKANKRKHEKKEYQKRLLLVVSV